MNVIDTSTLLLLQRSRGHLREREKSSSLRTNFPMTKNSENTPDWVITVIGNIFFSTKIDEKKSCVGQRTTEESVFCFLFPLSFSFNQVEVCEEIGNGSQEVHPGGAR